MQMANVLYGESERVGGKDTKSPPGSHSVLSHSSFKNNGKPLMTTTPEQIVPVHDIHRQDSSSSSSQQLLRYSSSESIQSLKSSPYHWTVSDNVYPGIPFQVAHYMCETNPDLLSQMEAVLHGSSGSVGNMKHNGAPNATSKSPKITSSFDHMCSVTDALALQESVIGDSCKQPAHPDVVAEVVAKVKNQYVRHNQHNLFNVTTSDGDKLSDHSTDVDSQLRADLSPESSSSFLECSPTSPYAPNTAFHDIDKNSLSDASKEMHRFPKDRITTVVERRSWWSSKPKEDDSGSVHDQEAISEPDSNRSSFSTRDRPRDESLNQYTESNSNAKEYPTDTRSIASEIESIVSERYEVESNFSERYDLQSNSSEVSGLEEEMFRIKKLLLEVPPNQDFAPTLGLEDGRLVDRQVHFEILREKASLEGQIEALTMELGRSNQEKTALRAQLVASRTQLNSQANTVRISKQEAQDAIMKMEDLEKALAETEDELTRLRGVVDSKTEATIQSSEVAKMAEEEAHQLKIILQEMRVEAESRDGAVRGLKTKVAELHVELQNALQSKNKLESDLQVSKSRIDSEQNMKEWYRQQLQESQTAKGKLHQDIITLKAFSADCESSVEKLRFERDQARLQLSELKERGVREKEGLLRHLKSIEADVRERESVFQQFQKEQGPVEEIVASQLVKMENEKKRMAEEAFFITDLKHNLEAARAEVDSKNLDVARLEKEVAQLMQQVTVQNKTVGERDLEIHTLRERLLDLESRVKEQQVALNVNEESLAAAKREVMARDVELTSIRTEKGDIDDTLVEVRGNVLKLDGRLKQMKEELTAKGEAVDKLQQEKAALLERLQSEDLVNRQLKKKLAKTEEETRVLREELRTASLSRVEVEEVKKTASVALSDAMETKETANRLSLDLNRIVNENQMLREKIDTLERYDVSQLTRDDVANKLMVKLTEVRKTLELKEKELQGVLLYNEELKSNLEKLTKSTAVLEEEEERRKESRLTSEDHALLLQDKLIEKEDSLLKAVTATRAAELKFEQVRDESDALRKELHAKIQQLEQVELNLKPVVEHHDNDGKVCVSSFGTQTDSFLNEGDKKSLQTCLEDSSTVNALTGSLKDLKTENLEQRRRYESNINVLTRKLKSALKNSKMLEEEVKTLNKKLAERTTLQKIPTDVDCPETTPPVQQILDVGSRNKDIKTNYYRKKISVLEIKVTELQRLLEVERQRTNKTQDLLIDMEKQRGKLDALAKNSSSLRQQASELEAALSERETALSELDLQARDAEVRERQKENHLKDSLRETQKKLASEQETVKELRKQIFKEKCENSGLRKEIVSLKSILEVANRSLETKKTEMAAAEHDLEEQHNSILKLRAEIGDLELKLAKSKEEVNKLKKKVEAGQAKDPLLADQIKTLSWHLREKNQEIVSLKNQLEQSGDRYRQELTRLEQAVNFSKKEMDEVRSELRTVSEERLSYQTKVTELRAALKTTMKQNEALRGRNSTNDDDVNRSDIHFLASPAPFDESLIASLLQQSLSLPEISRPLSNLQVCVNTLKQEMAILQQQLLEQTNGQS